MTYVVLVEGTSDQYALQTLAARRNLSVEVVPMGGATNIGHYLRRYAGRPVAGLYDLAEERFFARGLERTGHGTDLDRAALERLGFFVCITDLEDELLRAVGTDGMLRLMAQAGELDSFHTLQRQPYQRDRPLTEQLRRFLSGRSGKKAQYARLLAGAVEVVPRPLDLLLEHVSRP